VVNALHHPTLVEFDVVEQPAGFSPDPHVRRELASCTLMWPEPSTVCGHGADWDLPMWRNRPTTKACPTWTGRRPHFTVSGEGSKAWSAR
jgi:hypothetical protein